MAHHVDLVVGQNLRELRKSVGISQEELARQVGISYQQIQKYERAVNRISISRLLQFADVLNYPVKRFFRGLSCDDDMNRLAPDIEELIGLWRGLSHPRIKQQLLLMLKELNRPK